jgi:hypothetical protein
VSASAGNERSGLILAGAVAGPSRMTIMVNRASRTTPNPYNYGKPGEPRNINSAGINGLFNDRW